MIESGFPDEHVSYLKYSHSQKGYVYSVWSGSRAGTALVYAGNATLTHFTTPVTEPVFGPASGDTSPDNFDRNYAAPGQVVEDPSNPKTLYMLYEANNDCYGTSCRGSNYAWADPGITESVGSASRYPHNWTGFPSDKNVWGRTEAVRTPDKKPTTLPMKGGYWGDGLPSGFVDPMDPTHQYLYLFYSYHRYPTPSPDSATIEVARDTFADLRGGTPNFQKFDTNTKSFDIPFDGRGTSIVPPSADGSCAIEGWQSVSWNATLGAYLMIIACKKNDFDIAERWYYTTCSDLETEAWAPPVLLHAFTRLSWNASPVSLDQMDGYTTDSSGLMFFQHASYAPYTVPFSVAASTPQVP
jgi:hypothetical protein